MGLGLENFKKIKLIGHLLTKFASDKKGTKKEKTKKKIEKVRQEKRRRERKKI